MGGEAQVDWYDADIEVAGELRPVHIFAMRSMACGGTFHVAYYPATLQAGRCDASNYQGAVKSLRQLVTELSLRRNQHRLGGGSDRQPG